MDRNVMLQGMMNPIMSVGVIPGKCQADWTWIQEAMANADDPATAQNCIPGGAKDVNHDIMPGDLSFGLKQVRNPAMMEGEPNELGIVSMSGLDTSLYSSARSIEDQFYFQGFVATPCRVSGHHMDESTNDPDHGYATVRAGTCNTINNGTKTFYPGQYITTQMPAWKDKTSYGNEYTDPENPSVNQLARMGTPNGQWKWEVVPFDYTDFSLQLTSAYATMRFPSGSPYNPGIANMLFADFFKVDYLAEVPSYSTEAEEASGHKYGCIGTVLAGVETLAHLGYITINNALTPLNTPDEKKVASEKVRDMSAKLGLWNKEEQSADALDFLKIFANIHMADLFEGAKHVQDAKKHFQEAFGKSVEEVGKSALYGNDTTQNYLKLRAQLSKFTSGHLVGNWYSKTSKIVGKCLNVAAPSDTMHVMAGHFTL
jgi:hypothetical protein